MLVGGKGLISLRSGLFAFQSAVVVAAAVAAVAAAATFFFLFSLSFVCCCCFVMSIRCSVSLSYT